MGEHPIALPGGQVCNNAPDRAMPAMRSAIFRGPGHWPPGAAAKCGKMVAGLEFNRLGMALSKSIS